LEAERGGDGVSEDRVNRVGKGIKSPHKSLSRSKRVAQRELGCSPGCAGATLKQNGSRKSCGCSSLKTE
jgi:hypothetical protein